MPNFEIELASDTKTLPSAGMREAIASAVVGDEMDRECPTVNRLLERAADLLGQEAAILLPSGTMANEVAMFVHCQPGDEIYCHQHAHLLNYEGAGPSALAGVTAKPLQGHRGIFSPEAIRESIRPMKPYMPRSRLVTVEQTSNEAGGTVWTLDEIKAVVDEARHFGLKLHMDGARLMNASVATGVRPAEFAGMFDTIYLDFTKGLGCPFGAILAGSRDDIERAWRFKHRLGGAMRQVGMLAAACLWALDHNVERLKDDHDNARLLAAEMAKIDGISVEPVETNMVFFDVSGLGVTSDDFLELLKKRGTRAGGYNKTRLRFVTHLNVDREQIMRAAAIVADAAREAKGLYH